MSLVDELNLVAFGFAGAEPEATGRPSYHPATLLKLYIYGYLNRLQSSRRLERETQRNVELMWLTGFLSPDFKTIADFRRDNGQAIQKVCSHFIRLCREAKLFTEAVAAVDGTKFKVVNNSDRAFTARKLQVRQEQLEESVGRYLAELDRADREPTRVTEDRVAHIQKRIQTIKVRMRELNGIRAQMEASPDGQIALTDPDARCMASRGRDAAMVGYNVQTAVDAQHHLIVAHEVTNVGNDRTQLAPMSHKARDAMGCDPGATFIALADRGYFNGDQILDCAQAGIIALVPKSLTSNNRAKGLFDKQDFRYQPDSDTFQCPAGQQAIRRFDTLENGRKMIKYWSSACPHCPIKSSCTSGDYRRITRWEHEHVLDTMQQRLNDTPADTAANCGASLRNPKIMDGCDALSHQDVTEGQYGDELACTGLQREASDADPRNAANHGDDQGVRSSTKESHADLGGSTPINLSCRIGTGANVECAFSHSLGTQWSVAGGFVQTEAAGRNLVIQIL